MGNHQAHTSFLLALLAAGVVYGWLFLLQIDFHEDPFWPSTSGDVPRTAGFKAYTVAVRAAPLAALAGFVLGIAALLGHEEHHPLAITGH